MKQPKHKDSYRVEDGDIIERLTNNYCLQDLTTKTNILVNKQGENNPVIKPIYVETISSWALLEILN